MAKQGIINRDLSKDSAESGNYSGRDLKKGDTVYDYTGYTYGTIGKHGIAVSDKPDETPFFQIPEDAIDWQ